MQHLARHRAEGEASQAAVSLINNQGDVGKTLNDLGSDQSIQQLLASVLTAGVTAGVTSGLNLPNPATNTTFASRFTTYATQAMVGAGVNSLVYGQPLEETAKTALISALAQSLTSEIGDWGLEPGSAAKIVAHAVVQCAAASVQGNDCGSAALGGAIAEALAPVSQAADASELSQNLKLRGQIGNAIASMSTLLAASLTGSDTMTALGGAQMVDYYNRALHPEETVALRNAAKQLAAQTADGKALTPEQQQQLENYWFDQLDSEAKAKVDANNAKLRQDYLDQMAATNQPGYIGGASNYLSDAAVARQVVSGLSGSVIYGQDGSPIIADGSVLRAFEASNAQYYDSKLFLTNDSALLKKQFGSLGAADNAQALAARQGNISDAIGTNARNDAILKANQTPSEGTEAVAPETYLIGTGAVAKSLITAAVDAGRAALTNIADKNIETAWLASLKSDVGAIKGFINADKLNAQMTSAEWSPAWKTNTMVAESVLTPGTRVNMVVDESTYLNFINSGKIDMRFGGWATFDQIPNQSFVRNQLAITTEMKKDVNYVIEVEVTKPVTAQIGVVGPQGSATGGGNQLHFILGPSERSDVFKVVGERSLP